MSTHPVFLIVRAKLGEATKALVHMNELDVQQCALRVEHPDLYSPDVHAESMVTNVQGIYTHFEAILKTLANTIDGFSPSGEAWHREVLLETTTPLRSGTKMCSGTWPHCRGSPRHSCQTSSGSLSGSVPPARRRATQIADEHPLARRGRGGDDRQPPTSVISNLWRQLTRSNAGTSRRRAPRLSPDAGRSSQAARREHSPAPADSCRSPGPRSTPA